MVTYSIKDLENLCGIKAHTLRMWEKRYGILKAKRTESNIRFYDEADLQKALNLCALYKSGIKISHLAELTPEKIRELAAEQADVDLTKTSNLDALSITMLELDEYKFVKILDAHIEQNGFDQTMENILYPLLEKMSVMEITGTISEIHHRFVTNIIARKIKCAISGLRIPKHSATNNRILLFQQSNNNQYLATKYIEYLLKKAGHCVINLGQGVTNQIILESCKLFEPNYVFTIIDHETINGQVVNYVSGLTKLVDTNVIVSGSEINKKQLEEADNLIVLEDLDQIITFANDSNS